MRITAGKYKGRVVKSPETALTHPMGEREKLALFNIIGNNLDGLSILDAYAGSGALGIEALSRGAGRAVFVEKSPKVARTIKANLQGISEISPDNYAIICEDVKNLELKENFDLIIADPPYDNFEPENIEILTDFLKDGGLLALSHPGEAPEMPGLELIKTKKYARAHISIYEKQG